MCDVLFVCSVQGITDLNRVTEGLIESERPSKWRSFDQLHDQIVWSNVIYLANIGMIQCRDSFCFTLETFRKLRCGYLDRHVAIQPRIMRAIHLAHASRAYGRKNLIRTELVAERERHLGVKAKFSPSKSK